MPEQSRVSISKVELSYLVEPFACDVKMTLLHVPDLKMAHEQQTKSLEEEFEKIRLSLQVNADLKVTSFFN